MTFSADRWGLRVTPIRRDTPLYGKLLDKPRLRPANLGMNYWKGQSWAPWWGWHIWLAEWSNWHSLRKEGKKRPLLSQQLRAWPVQWLSSGGWALSRNLRYWTFTSEATCVTEVNIKIPETAALMAVIYHTQEITHLKILNLNVRPNYFQEWRASSLMQETLRADTGTIFCESQ